MEETMQTEITDIETHNIFTIDELEPVLWEGLNQWLPEEGNDFYA